MLNNIKYVGIFCFNSMCSTGQSILHFDIEPGFVAKTRYQVYIKYQTLITVNITIKMSWLNTFKL